MHVYTSFLTGIFLLYKPKIMKKSNSVRKLQIAVLIFRLIGKAGIIAAKNSLDRFFSRQTGSRRLTAKLKTEA